MLLAILVVTNRKPCAIIAQWIHRMPCSPGHSISKSWSRSTWSSDPDGYVIYFKAIQVPRRGHVFVGDIVDGRLNPANSPVEVGSFSHHICVLYVSQVVQDFFHQQYLFYVLNCLEIFWIILIYVCSIMSDAISFQKYDSDGSCNSVYGRDVANLEILPLQ